MRPPTTAWRGVSAAGWAGLVSVIARTVADRTAAEQVATPACRGRAGQAWSNSVLTCVATGTDESPQHPHATVAGHGLVGAGGRCRGRRPGPPVRAPPAPPACPAPPLSPRPRGPQAY